MNSPINQTVQHADRLIDLDFCKAFHESLADLSETTLIERLRERVSDASFLLNPQEFLQQVSAKNLLPPAFDARGYIVAHADLWEMQHDWEGVLHYLRFGHREPRQLSVTFDPVFYRDVYHAGKATDERALESEWRANRAIRFACAAEMLWANGFKDGAWIAKFDTQSYLVANNLCDQLETGLQALAHFVTIGVPALLPPSTTIDFDPAFQREARNAPESLDDAGVYRWWLETGFVDDKPANERGFLEKLGIPIDRIPDGFLWRRYLADRPDVAEDCSNKWSAFAHFAHYGALEATPLPLENDCAAQTLVAIADRLATLDRHDDADQVYERVWLVEDGVDPYQLNLARHHAADNSLRRNQYARALKLYLLVIEAGRANYWSYYNAIDAAHRLSEFAQAARLIDQALEQFPRNQRLLDFHRTIRSAVLERDIRRYVAALKEGDALLPAIEDQIRSVYQDCERVYERQYGPLPALSTLPPPDPRRKLRVVALTNQDLAQCTYYRVTQKYEQLAESGVDYEAFERDDVVAFRDALATADVAIFYRLAASFDVLDMIAYCRSLGVPSFYEIDDLVFDPNEFPEPIEAYGGSLTQDQHFELRAGVPLIRSVAAQCDAGIASTEHLASQLRYVVRGDAIVHRNGLSKELQAVAEAGENAARMATELDAVKPFITLFYGSGTKAHGRDFQEIVLPALERLMAENSNIRFHACGYVNVSSLAARFPDRVAHVDALLDRTAYSWMLSRADVNISILTQSNFNDAKSEIKWLEAAAFGIPSVVSNVKGFTETLTNHTELVLAAPDSGEWFAALSSLVADPTRLRKMGRAARSRALTHYKPDVMGHSFNIALRGACATMMGAPLKRFDGAKRPTLMVVNVFYPPQAIGGATRVVHDEVRALKKARPDWDIVILCGNDEPAPPYELTAYWHESVRVYSISTLPREHMDWHAEDAKVRPIAERVIEAVKPDLVHFHATQRLGVGVVEAIRDRQIPYVITAHDAWWISDHQFLMDRHDRMRLPWMPDTFGVDSNPHSMSASLSRRFRLMSCLEGAACVIAVSSAFADIYRKAGAPRVMALENALSDLPPLEATPRTAQNVNKVRLGHFGGMTYHKGFFLLKRALCAGFFPNLELLVVDNAMRSGDIRRERWGATDVTIIGKVKQKDIGQLYGRIDVLIAPSMWPESFGLVTREALGYGKWIVAGNRGAVGEPVENGRNGFVVDVNQLDGTKSDSLTSVLKVIEAAPSAFQNPSCSGVIAPTLMQHIDELGGLYESILSKRKLLV